MCPRFAVIPFRFQSSLDSQQLECIGSGYGVRWLDTAFGRDTELSFTTNHPCIPRIGEIERFEPELERRSKRCQGTALQMACAVAVVSDRGKRALLNASPPSRPQRGQQQKRPAENLGLVFDEKKEMISYSLIISLTLP